MRHQLIDSMHVLHRPVEIAARSGHYQSRLLMTAFTSKGKWSVALKLFSGPDITIGSHTGLQLAQNFRNRLHDPGVGVALISP